MFFRKKADILGCVGFRWIHMVLFQERKLLEQDLYKQEFVTNSNLKLVYETYTNVYFWFEMIVSCKNDCSVEIKSLPQLNLGYIHEIVQ